MTDKILSLLGFAVKAGRISFGMRAACDATRSNKSALIVLACDLSPKSEKEIRFFSEKQHVPVIQLDCSMEYMSHALGHKAGIVSVNDKGFASAVLAHSNRAR